MPALPINFDPYNPIPNGPFYSPLSYYLQGPTGPLVVGSGLSVSLNGTISATGGGGGGGTVTSITAGAGLTGGTITSTGTIALANSGVTAGSYTFASISVDQYGRVTSAGSGNPVVSVSANSPLLVSGSVSAPTIGIQLATTSQYGATQLNNTTSSTLTNQALTAAAGKSLQDQINALSQNASGLILAGTLNVTTGLVVSATTAGNLAGFTAGAVVPAASPAINDYYLIVTTAAPSGSTYTPTGGPTITGVIVGDYIIVASGVWSILRVGPVAAAYATTSTPGIVELATVSEAQAGVNPNLVLTPNTGAQTYVARGCFTTSGQILAGTGSYTYTAVPPGIDGQVLTADSSCAAGVKWDAGGGGGGGGITALSGNTPVFTTPATITSGVGTIGINAASTTACGAVQLATTADVLTGLSTTLAVTPAAGAAGYVTAATFNAPGDLVVGTGNDVYSRLGVGANGEALIACSACAQGVTWDNPMQPATPSTYGAFCGFAAGTGGNLSVGSSSLANVTGSVNTAFGSNAATTLTTGNGNTALGAGALATSSTGSSNVAVGACALYSSTTDSSTAVGGGALKSLSTGFNNTALGALAACSLTTGCYNVILGQGSGLSLVSGSENVFVGDAVAPIMTSGINNVFIGSSAAAPKTSGNNNIVIGADAVSSSATVSNEVTVGNSSNTSYRIYAASWSNASDARDKKDVENLALGLDFVESLRPVRYVWNYRDGSSQNGTTDIGFIAQELLEAQEQAGADYAQFVNQSNPDQLMITQGKLIPVLVNAIKELRAEIEDLKAKLS